MYNLVSMFEVLIILVYNIIIYTVMCIVTSRSNIKDEHIFIIFRQSLRLFPRMFFLLVFVVFSNNLTNDEKLYLY